jgi:hypothetical protein
MQFQWFLLQLSPQTPGFWLLLSIVSLVVLVALDGRLSVRQRYWTRLTRWVMIPYAGLLAGGLSPTLMGLTNIDWQDSLRIGLSLVFAIWVLLFLARASMQPAAPKPTDTTRTAIGGWISAVSETVYDGAEQFQWSFLRGATWEMLLTSSALPDLPAYYAVWIAAVLALPDVLLERSSFNRLIGLFILLVSTALFYYTRNFWLCWLFHASVGLWFRARHPFGPNDDCAESGNEPVRTDKSA